MFLNINKQTFSCTQNKLQKCSLNRSKIDRPVNVQNLRVANIKCLHNPFQSYCV